MKKEERNPKEGPLDGVPATPLMEEVSPKVGQFEQQQLKLVVALGDKVGNPLNGAAGSVEKLQECLDTLRNEGVTHPALERALEMMHELSAAVETAQRGLTSIVSPFESEVKGLGKRRVTECKVSSAAPAQKKERLQHHILVVDDQMFNRRLLTNYFTKSCKWAVTEAEGGEQAVRLIRNNPAVYDIIFMDVIMPGKNGNQTTKDIRALGDPVRQVPIVRLSTDNTEVAIAESKKAGMTVTTDVGKPYNYSKLVKIVEDHSFGDPKNISTFTLGSAGLAERESERANSPQSVLGQSVAKEQLPAPAVSRVWDVRTQDAAKGSARPTSPPSPV